VAINTGSTFVVRERVEALEEKLDSVLDPKGLQDFSRAHARTALDSTVDAAKREIARSVDSSLATLEERRIEFDAEAASIQVEIHRNHKEFIDKMHEIADRMKRSLTLASVAALVVLGAEIAISYFTN
jgi:hypothetical protein